MAAARQRGQDCLSARRREGDSGSTGAPLISASVGRRTGPGVAVARTVGNAGVVSGTLDEKGSTLLGGASANPRPPRGLRPRRPHRRRAGHGGAAAVGASRRTMTVATSEAVRGCPPSIWSRGSDLDIEFIDSRSSRPCLVCTAAAAEGHHLELLLPRREPSSHAPRAHQDPRRRLRSGQRRRRPTRLRHRAIGEGIIGSR